jgi:hypothetical protein
MNIQSTNCVVLSTYIPSRSQAPPNSLYIILQKLLQLRDNLSSGLILCHDQCDNVTIIKLFMMLKPSLLLQEILIFEAKELFDLEL